MKILIVMTIELCQKLSHHNLSKPYSPVNLVLSLKQIATKMKYVLFESKLNGEYHTKSHRKWEHWNLVVFKDIFATITIPKLNA